ncbi:MAG: hypothetical protein ACQESP_00265 [Candidatus Muiribacteriota bacterium]
MHCNKIIILIVILFQMIFITPAEQNKDIIDEIFGDELERQEMEEKKESPEFFIELANEQKQEGNYRQAADLFKRASDLDPSAPGIRAQRFKMEALAYINEYIFVIYLTAFIVIFSIIMKIASSISKNSDKRVEDRKKKDIKKLKDAFMAGKYDNAIKKGRDILEKTYVLSIPDKFNIYTILSKAYYRKKVFVSAKKYAYDALKLKSAAPELHDILCNIFLSQREMSPRAIKEYERALKKKPNDTKLLKILFEYYYAKKELSDNAVAIYNKILKFFPDKIEAYDMLCLRGIRKKDLSEGIIPIYETVIDQLRPHDISLKNILLKAYFNNSKYKKANKLVRELIVLPEFIEDREMHKILFKTSQALNKFDEMNNLYNELKEKYPDSKSLANIYEETSSRHEDYQLEEKIKNNKDKNQSTINKGIKICTVCAHINVQDAKFCEKCKKPLNI